MYVYTFSSHNSSTVPHPSHSPAICIEPPVGRAEPPLRRHTVARSTDTSRSAATERARFFPSSRRRLTGDGTRTQTHEMTRARDLAQLSGHSETDCEEVRAQCHGDVDRAIDRLLNSA